MCLCLDSMFEILLDKFLGLEVSTSCEAADATKPSQIDISENKVNGQAEKASQTEKKHNVLAVVWRFWSFFW